MGAAGSNDAQAPRLDRALQVMQLDLIRRCAMIAHDPRPAGRAAFRAQLETLAQVTGALAAAEAAVRLAEADIPIAPMPLEPLSPLLAAEPAPLALLG